MLENLLSDSSFAIGVGCSKKHVYYGFNGFQPTPFGLFIEYCSVRGYCALNNNETQNLSFLIKRLSLEKKHDLKTFDTKNQGD